MERNLSWSEAWENINKTIESVKDEGDMLPLLEGNISYVLQCYYKQEGYAEILLNMVDNIRRCIEETSDNDDDDDICDDCKNSESSEDEDEEDKLNREVRKVLNLRPLKYSYPPKEDADDCYPEPGVIHKCYMRICVSEFKIEGSVEESLNRVAIEGYCEFKWPMNYWGSNEEHRVKLSSPTWKELIVLANRAFIDGNCPDHCFLEGFGKDTGTNTYRFHFGS
jgi:hypothetical protein